jgi:hypothetical protein
MQEAGSVWVGPSFRHRSPAFFMPKLVERGKLSSGLHYRGNPGPDLRGCAGQVPQSPASVHLHACTLRVDLHGLDHRLDAPGARDPGLVLRV